MNSKLAIIDWGIGGLGIYKKVKERLGDVPVTYFSDTGATPYGKLTRRELVLRLDKVIAFLEDKGVSHLVIGCNAASTALEYLDRRSLTIEGVIESAVNATVELRPRRLGLIGGRRTVLSGIYRRSFAAHGLRVEQRIAQPLSGLIESGDTDSRELRDNCRRILDPLKNCSHILLACTHYPSIIPVMNEFVSPDTSFIDPSSAIVRKVENWKLAAGRTDEFLSTGDTETMKYSAGKAFGVTIKTAASITL